MPFVKNPVIENYGIFFIFYELLTMLKCFNYENKIINIIKNTKLWKHHQIMPL